MATISAEDREVAQEVAMRSRKRLGRSRMWVNDLSRLQVDIAQAIADTREACAVKCDELRAIFAKSTLGDSYTNGLLDGVDECTRAIRGGGGNGRTL